TSLPRLSASPRPCVRSLSLGDALPTSRDRVAGRVHHVRAQVEREGDGPCLEVAAGQHRLVADGRRCGPQSDVAAGRGRQRRTGRRYHGQLAGTPLITPVTDIRLAPASG